jgi:ligand-binding sensor domain-containing protein/signal transduction histidine kinase
VKCGEHDFVLALYRWVLMLALLVFGPTNLFGRAESQGVLPYGVHSWQTDDGLPQNSVYAISQTADGYLWVGTHEGLARFDGVRFLSVDDKAAPELRHGFITALCATRDGSLWIACDGSGLTRLKAGGFTHFTEADGLPSNQTRCLLEGKDGSLWIGSEAGLTRYRDGKFNSYAEKHGLGDNSVRAICEDHQGVIRVATRRGLSSLNRDGVISTVSFGAGWNANSLKCVCEDREGKFWVGSTDGLHCWQNESKLIYGPNEGLRDNTINSVCVDRAGQLWVGTYAGLVRIVGGKVIPRPSRESVFGDLVYSIFEDREGNLWVGAQDGLYRLNPARFTTYTTDQGLARNNVMSVLEDRAGTIWIGTWRGGLSALRGETITTYGTTNGLTHDSILSLHEARDGSLWIGMEFEGGLNRFKGSCSNSFPRQSGVINAPIRVIHEDRRGRLWVGTSRGLNMLSGGRFRAFTAANGLAGDTVLAICEDSQTNLWFGTETGLSRWHEGKFTNFTTRDGLSHNAVGALYEDRDGVLWIGTKGGGLNRLKAGKFSAYTSKQGLFSDEVYEVLEDDFGNFWMSCRRGIFRVARKDLDALDRGTLKTVNCTVFGKADGLVSVQCNGVAKPGGWKGRDGRLWFPTIRGVVAVECRIETNEQPPPVAIETLIADKIKMEPGPESPGSSAASTSPRAATLCLPPSPVRIPPGRGELEIHYTALSLQAPERNRFKYILEGVNSDWVDAGADRVAYYNNVAPGNYRFRVIACNNDGVWNEAGATLSLVLLPHYWQTWWFKAVLLGAVALALTLLYRIRVARLRDLERLRIQIAANLHDDVGARLTKVAMVTESVERDTPEHDRLKPHIQTILRTTREIVQAMDEIVWTINPQNDTLENLANYILQYAQEYFQDTAVRCRLDVPAQLPDHEVSTGARHHLFMVVKEALNNALKHAHASEVHVGLAVADGRMTITITDNGCGFSPGQPCGSGNGLKNMRARLEQIGGRLRVESEPGHGTRIQMEVAD